MKFIIPKSFFLFLFILFLGAAPIAQADIILCGPSGQAQMTDRLHMKLFDTAVNTGVGGAIRILQRALNDISSKGKITVDGALGPRTRAAMCGVSESELLAVYVEKQADYYVDIVIRNPSQIKFLKGWIRRALWVPE